MKKLYLSLFLLVLLAPSCLAASTRPTPATLTNGEKKEVTRIENYLNKLKSVRAQFIQVSDTGALREGEIAIKRPGKMRVNYAAPSKDFIISDGSFVHIWDGEMEQQSSIPLDASLAHLILEDNIHFEKPLIITRYARYPGKIELTITSQENPEEGELTLVFQDKPLKLRQWKILDPVGHTTGVSLMNAEENVSFPPRTFHFVSPNFGKSRNSR